MERTCLSSTSYRFWIGMRHREFGDQRLKPFVVLLRWFMNSFCFVVGRIILLKTHHCHQETLFPWKGVNGLQRYLGRWYVAVWVVDGDQYGHPDRSAAVQQTLMLCVFWLLSIRVNKLFFLVVSATAAHQLDWTTEVNQPSLCISEACLPMTLSLVHHCFFLVL